MASPVKEVINDKIETSSLQSTCIEINANEYLQTFYSSLLIFAMVLDIVTKKCTIFVR